MRILTHPVHTAWEYEFAKTGHEIWSVTDLTVSPKVGDEWVDFRGTLVGGGGVWNHKSRPLPGNISFIPLAEAIRGDFDVCIVHTAAWLEKLKDVACPMIFKVHVVPPPDLVPEWAEERLAALTFNSDLAISRVVTRRDILKNVIRVPADPLVFGGYVGDRPRALAIGNLIAARPEKGLDRLRALATAFPLDLWGGGNSNLPFARGEAASLAALAELYRHQAVFVDAGDRIGLSTIEAMMTGAPAVIFDDDDRGGIFRDGWNCFRVRSVAEARDRVETLRRDAPLRARLGRAARATALEYFNTGTFIEKWNALLRKITNQAQHAA